jgi:hypothetical protein
VLPRANLACGLPDHTPELRRDHPRLCSAWANRTRIGGLHTFARCATLSSPAKGRRPFHRARTMTFSPFCFLAFGGRASPRKNIGDDCPLQLSVNCHETPRRYHAILPLACGAPTRLQAERHIRSILDRS